jgi:hypothetical protein
MNNFFYIAVEANLNREILMLVGIEPQGPKPPLENGLPF